MVYKRYSIVLACGAALLSIGCGSGAATDASSQNAASTVQTGGTTVTGATPGGNPSGMATTGSPPAMQSNPGAPANNVTYDPTRINPDDPRMVHGQVPTELPGANPNGPAYGGNAPGSRPNNAPTGTYNQAPPSNKGRVISIGPNGRDDRKK